jgi:tetratricopeptide (TPR) repeat protein
MSAMSGYGAREVAKMLGLSEGQVRSWVRAGFLDPSRGPRGELRFSFQDLVLLRTAQGLVSARIPPRRVRSALRKLKGQLPGGRPLRAVHIRAEGDKIVVGDGDAQWSPESGQVLFDFGARELARKVAPLHLRAREPSATAADWYERACDLEESEPDAAQDAYRRALELDPDLADAHVNLGRLVHEAGDPRAAAEHYRSAIELDPGSVIALFNLGVALTDLRMPDEAILAYRTALAADAGCADAHYNLASLYEQRGDAAAALRHLRTYRKLVQA